MPPTDGIGDDLALVGQRGEGAAMQRLEPLGVLERCGERAGDVGGDAVAAERDGVGVDEMSVGEHRERGGAGAEIDQATPSLASSGVITDERARIRCGDQARDAEMAALDAQHEVAHGHLVGGDGVDIDASRSPHMPCGSLMPPLSSRR